MEDALDFTGTNFLNKLTFSVCMEGLNWLLH